MTVLAASTSQPIAQGPGSIGPFPIPAEVSGVALTIQRTGLPDVPDLLSVLGMASYDGGVTFEPMGGGGIDGGVLQARGGGTLAQSVLSFTWEMPPTHFRIDVDAQVAFTATFSVDTR